MSARNEELRPSGQRDGVKGSSGSGEGNSVESAALLGALACAERGWAVFPLTVHHDEAKCDGGNASCKTFDFPTSWKATSTTDPRRIRSWDWSARNGYGIDCGKSGLVVADRDPGDDWPFDGTRVHRSGRGEHYIYEDMLGLPNAQGLAPWRIDVRGDGGLIVGPGSHHPHAPGGVYSVLVDTAPALPPAELVEALQRRSKASQSVHAGKADGTAYADLSDDERATVDEAIASKLAYWRGWFDKAIHWDEGVHKYENGAGEVGGWELLSRDVAWSMACLAASSWSPIDVAQAERLRDEIVPEEIREADKCDKAIDEQLVRKARDEADLSFRAVALRDDPSDVFGEWTEDDPNQCSWDGCDKPRARGATWGDGEGELWATCANHREADLDRRSTTVAEESIGSTWKRQDVGAMLVRIEAGEVEKIVPTVCRMDEGGCLFYPGRINTLFGESTSGKTWVALLAAKQEVEAGHRVVFIDFEDDLSSALLRLLNIGTDQEALRQRFIYMSPEEKLTPQVRRALMRTLATEVPTLVVIDSTGESLAMEGKNPNADEDVATWVRLLPKACTPCGAAVVVVDHIPKDKDGNGAPIGSQRKRAATFSAYRVETVEPFSRDRAGSARIVANKDKAGNYRRDDVVATLSATPGMEPELELVLAAVAPPVVLRTAYDDALLMKICRALQTAFDESADEEWPGASTNHVTSRIGGNASKARAHLDYLVKIGNVEREKRGQTNYHTLRAAYVPDDVFEDEE